MGYNEASYGGSNSTGSHNVVVGAYHNYTSYGGLVVGSHNTISAKYSSVSGGLLGSVTGNSDWRAGSYFYDSPL
ncbi:MAG: hypothetical protein GY754_16205 [bacterium]|nr:hypothetical protein [bacterium]